MIGAALTLGCAVAFADPRPEVLENSIGIELRLIPVGPFTMGQATDETDETPRQETLTKPFYIGVYEVTNAQWKQVMKNVPSHWKDDDRPVEQVSWNDVVKFCEKLSELPDERQAGRVYRLPTNAEWEYACRAGSTTRYSFGDDELQLGEYGWFDGNSGRQTHAIGTKKPNAWGLFDMHGNVWEWCSDWEDGLPRGAVTDPQGPDLQRPSGAPIRGLRGGNWRDAAGACQSSSRRGFDPSIRNHILGFRLALSPPEVQRAPPAALK